MKNIKKIKQLFLFTVQNLSRRTFIILCIMAFSGGSAFALVSGNHADPLVTPGKHTTKKPTNETRTVEKNGSLQTGGAQTTTGPSAHSTAPAPSAAKQPSASNSTAATTAPPANTTANPTQPVPQVDLRALIAAHTTTGPLNLGVNTYYFTGFDSTLNGVTLPTNVTAFNGSGIDRTIVEMLPNTSTSGGSVPTSAGTTNALSLVKDVGTPTLSNFTLRGTTQGHLYNGLRVHMIQNARVSNVKITGIPGNADIPPGETFGLNDYKTNGSIYTGLEIDGAGVGASDFATNSSSNVTVTNSNFYGSVYAHGATFWQTNNITITDTQSHDNKDAGFNFERVSGTVTMNRPRSYNDTLADIRIGTDQVSATYNIYNPSYTGPKLRIKLAPTYNGTTNKQLMSDVHVYVGGVDQTNTVVQWVTQ